MPPQFRSTSQALTEHKVNNQTQSRRRITDGFFISRKLIKNPTETDRTSASVGFIYAFSEKKEILEIIRNTQAPLMNTSELQLHLLH